MPRLVQSIEKYTIKVGLTWLLAAVSRNICLNIGMDSSIVIFVLFEKGCEGVIRGVQFLRRRSITIGGACSSLTIFSTAPNFHLIIGKSWW